MRVPPLGTSRAGKGRSRLFRLARTVLPAVAVIAVVAVAVALAMTSRPGFFSSYRGLTRHSKTLVTSKHKGLGCSDCHLGKGSRLAFSAASVADFYSGLVQRGKVPTYVKFSKPTRAACLACHEHDWSDDASRTVLVPHPAHYRVATEERDCMPCHKWTAHEETYMERHRTMPFSGVCTGFECHVGTRSKDECRFCHHALKKESDEWTRAHPAVVQARGANACMDICHEPDQCRLCHTTGKKPDVEGPLVQAGFRAIQEGHAKPDWLDRHGEEALANQKRCLFCHVSLSECEDCHSKRPAFHGSPLTWLSEHKKHAKDERRCLTCHQKRWCKECHDEFKELR